MVEHFCKECSCDSCTALKTPSERILREKYLPRLEDRALLDLILSGEIRYAPCTVYLGELLLYVNSPEFLKIRGAGRKTRQRFLAAIMQAKADVLDIMNHRDI